MSVQRRRAEKATADVLAILENNGVSNIYEELDSSSNQGAPFESNMDNGSTKEEESSVSSKVRRKWSEELSGSDLDFSPVSDRSLSWKGRKSASHSPEKYKDSLVRRRDSFSSMGFSSPKHCQGKSCRQIRRRESRLVHYTVAFIPSQQCGMPFIYIYIFLFKKGKTEKNILSFSEFAKESYSFS